MSHPREAGNRTNLLLAPEQLRVLLRVSAAAAAVSRLGLVTCDGLNHRPAAQQQ